MIGGANISSLVWIAALCVLPVVSFVAGGVLIFWFGRWVLRGVRLLR